MTRSAKKDMGPGLSHKTIIIDLYLKNYTFSDIEMKTNHSETSVKRYLADFAQVATLCQQNFSRNQILMISQKSDRLVREYIQIYETYSSQNSQRMLDMITPQNPGKEAEKKPIVRKAKEVKTISKPLTKEQIQLKKVRRIIDKSLKQLTAVQIP